MKSVVVAIFGILVAFAAHAESATAPVDSGVRIPYDEKPLLPFLRRDKEMFTQKVGALTGASLNEQILRARLLEGLLCQVESDAAVKACSDLKGSEELDGQNLQGLGDFNFDSASFAIVNNALQGLMQGVLFSLSPEQTPNAKDILLASHVATASPLPDAGRQIAARILAHPELLNEIQNSQTLGPFAPLLMDITAWLQNQPARTPLALKEPRWKGSFNYGLSYRLSSQGRLVGFVDGKPFEIPPEVQNVKVSQFVTDDKDYCAKTASADWLCWGENFGIALSEQRRFGIGTGYSPLAVWKGKQTSMQNLDLVEPDGDLVSLTSDRCTYGKTSIVDGWLLLSRGDLHYYAVLNSKDPDSFCMGSVFKAELPIDPTAVSADKPISLPAGAHELTTYHGRLFYLTATGQLQSVARYETRPSVLEAFGVPQNNLEALQASDHHFCVLPKGQKWLCYLEDERGVHLQPTGSRGQLYIQYFVAVVYNNFFNLVNQTGENEMNEVNPAGQGILPLDTSRSLIQFGEDYPSYGQYNPFVCAVEHGQVHCYMGEKIEGLPDKFDPFPGLKNVTEILGNGIIMCALQNRVASCLNIRALNLGLGKSGPNPNLSPLTLDPILASTTTTLVSSDHEGICKLQNQQVRCLIGVLEQPNPNLIDDDRQIKNVHLTTTSFSLPNDERVLRTTNQRDLCFESQKFVRCYDVNGKLEQTYVLERRGTKP